MVDISELLVEMQRVRKAVEDVIVDEKKNTLTLVHLGKKNPFDSFYNEQNKELNIIINRSVPCAIHSLHYAETYHLPKETKAIKVSYNGENLDHLSTNDYLRKIFPNVGPLDESE